MTEQPTQPRPRSAGYEQIGPDTSEAIGLPPVDVTLIYVTRDDGARSTLVAEPAYADMIREALKDGEPFTLEPGEFIPVPLIADGFPQDWSRDGHAPEWHPWTAATR